jgi:hypothetical protein
MTTLDIPKDSPFARTFPAAAPSDAHWTERVVTQGHADYCKIWGHATWTHDGEALIRCPRCGNNKCHTDHKFDCGV